MMVSWMKSRDCRVGRAGAESPSEASGSLSPFYVSGDLRIGPIKTQKIHLDAFMSLGS